MESARPLFHSGGSRFLHGDYSLKNIVEDNDFITGVVDFEFAMAGDPSWDIHHFLTKAIDVHVPREFLDAFLVAYARNLQLPPHFFEKAEFMRYHLAFRRVIMLNSTLRSLNPDEQEQYRVGLKKWIEGLVDRTDPYLSWMGEYRES
jgi:aminoglycoside phosphotransferase (APT) family kinase protein